MWWSTMHNKAYFAHFSTSQSSLLQIFRYRFQLGKCQRHARHCHWGRTAAMDSISNRWTNHAFRHPNSTSSTQDWGWCEGRVSLHSFTYLQAASRQQLPVISNYCCHPLLMTNLCDWLQIFLAEKWQFPVFHSVDLVINSQNLLVVALIKAIFSQISAHGCRTMNDPDQSWNIVITVTGSGGDSNFDRLCSGSMDAGWDGGEGVGGGRHESCEDQNYHAAG